MKNTFTFVIAIVLLALLLLYSVTYQVRFDEVAVVTRFGKADVQSVRNAGTEDESGLHFKWPRPIDAVKTYDKRVQILEDRPEEQQTLDGVSVVLQTYLAWRIADPLEFYRSLVSVEEAEKFLRGKLRDARKIIGARYTFSDLANSDPQQLKLAELEGAILDHIRKEVQREEGARHYGIELQSVGIKRVLLAPKTTEEVFNRMKSTRQRMAEGYRQEGESRAKAIKASAESMKTTILSFADSRARQIRSEGEKAASQYLKLFAQDPQFAIDLQKLEALLTMFRDTAKGKTTFVLDSEHPLFQFLRTPPQAPQASPAKAQQQQETAPVARQP